MQYLSECVVKSELEEISENNFYHSLKFWECDAPVSLETRNCNIPVTAVKKQTRLLYLWFKIGFAFSRFVSQKFLHEMGLFTEFGTTL